MKANLRLIDAAFGRPSFAAIESRGAMTSDTPPPHAVSISVPLTKSLERLLTRAATSRSQTAQELAKRILCEWLLEESGLGPEARAKRA
jgi:hypothetical protein